MVEQRDGPSWLREDDNNEFVKCPWNVFIIKRQLNLFLIIILIVIVAIIIIMHL